MWLIVLAPLVSQLRVAARPANPVATALCSAEQPSRGIADIVHANPLAACDYCNLLTDHAAAPALPPVLPLFVMLVVAAVFPALSVRFVPRGAFPSGRPRGPPVFS